MLTPTPILLGGAPEGDYAAQVKQAQQLVDEREADDTLAERLEKEAERLGAPEPSLIKPEKVEAAKPPKEKKHDTSFANPERPKAGTTTALVWELCDALKAKLGRTPTSKEALADADREGINNILAGFERAYQRVFKRPFRFDLGLNQNVLPHQQRQFLFDQIQFYKHLTRLQRSTFDHRTVRFLKSRNFETREGVDEHARLSEVRLDVLGQANLDGGGRHQMNGHARVNFNSGNVRNVHRCLERISHAVTFGGLVAPHSVTC
jgi:hypothetical protein